MPLTDLTMEEVARKHINHLYIKDANVRNESSRYVINETKGLVVERCSKKVTVRLI